MRLLCRGKGSAVGQVLSGAKNEAMTNWLVLPRGVIGSKCSDGMNPSIAIRSKVGSSCGHGPLKAKSTTMTELIEATRIPKCTEQQCVLTTQRRMPWQVTCIDPVHGVVKPLIGHKVGAQIVMKGRAANGDRIRWIFSDINPDSFHWRGERLSGKRWCTYEEVSARRKSRESASANTRFTVSACVSLPLQALH
jgi:hypothetical protein